MLRGIYNAASGMLAQQAVQDAVAGNLANINTVGYKQDVPTFRALHEMALRRNESAQRASTSIGDLGMGVEFDSVSTDFNEGTLAATHNATDLALSGAGFFTVLTGAGERYTRSGQFHLQPGAKDAAGKPQGFLADDSGNALMGLKGRILLSSTANLTVDDRGNVFDGKTKLDQLKLIDANPSMLNKVGSNLYTINGATKTADVMVKQGFLEQSNVSAVSSMVRMITVQRAYEAAQKAVLAQDDTLAKTVNELPRT